MGLNLMSRVHRLLLRRGALDDILPKKADLDGGGDKPEREAVKAEIEARAEDEQQIRVEVRAAIRRLQQLDHRNHYGESLRKAFGGR